MTKIRAAPWFFMARPEWLDQGAGDRISPHPIVRGPETCGGLPGWFRHASWHWLSWLLPAARSFLRPRSRRRRCPRCRRHRHRRRGPADGPGNERASGDGFPEWLDPRAARDLDLERQSCDRRTDNRRRPDRFHLHADRCSAARQHGIGADRQPADRDARRSGLSVAGLRWRHHLRPGTSFSLSSSSDPASAHATISLTLHRGAVGRFRALAGAENAQARESPLRGAASPLGPADQSAASALR